MTPNTFDPAPFACGLPLTPAQARTILLADTSPDMLVMCRGYNDDDEEFTELVRGDDDELDFEDKNSYPEFHLWLRLPSGLTAPATAEWVLSMFGDHVIMQAADASQVRWLDREKRLWVARGKYHDVFCVDEGGGEASVVAMQPASEDGQPTPQVMAFIMQLLARQQEAVEEELAAA